ncbi:unnamed protein product [Rhizoctonia solani]|uniref:Uncharacterized protein n=1 Tax=Rhizoctonia solani TaxID=456999 RepID=A0A8H2Y0E5_9AGAM|nr:unnamed protein product [Rhizoctonia solani]
MRFFISLLALGPLMALAAPIAVAARDSGEDYSQVPDWKRDDSGTDAIKPFPWKRREFQADYAAPTSWKRDLKTDYPPPPAWKRDDNKPDNQPDSITNPDCYIGTASSLGLSSAHRSSSVVTVPTTAVPYYFSGRHRACAVDLPSVIPLVSYT